MKFKNTDDLLDKILNNELIVEMKLKKGNVVNAFGDKRLPIIFYMEKKNGLNVDLKILHHFRQ